MSYKHTPGPWKWGNGYAGLGNRQLGLEVLDWLPYEGMHLAYHENAETSSANARLIAAAPELLEALEMVLDGLVMADSGGRYSAEIRDARAAIAKATGGAQ